LPDWCGELKKLSKYNFRKQVKMNFNDHQMVRCGPLRDGTDGAEACREGKEKGERKKEKGESG
jgi:hypothetical protein